MGRKQINFESAVVRLPDGSLKRLQAVLEEGESQSDFLREAVEREIKRRERKT
jgi:hypothetical protein